MSQLQSIALVGLPVDAHRAASGGYCEEDIDMALILLWLLGVPLTLIIILFLLGVGH